MRRRVRELVPRLDSNREINIAFSWEWLLVDWYVHEQIASSILYGLSWIVI